MSGAAKLLLGLSIGLGLYVFGYMILAWVAYPGVPNEVVAFFTGLFSGFAGMVLAGVFNE